MARWSVTIPPNAMAWLGLTDAEAAKYKLNDVRLTSNRVATPATKDGRTGYDLSAGTYSFEVTDVQ